MFWKIDEETGKVIRRTLTEDGFAEEARKSGHASFVDTLEEGDAEKVFAQLQRDEEFPDSDESGSEERFHARVQGFREKSQPVYRHHLWWLIHNCVAHPMIGVVPCRFTFRFHDYTSRKINGD